MPLNILLYYGFNGLIIWKDKIYLSRPLLLNLLISNISGNKIELDIIGADLSNARYSVIDNIRLLSWSPATNKIENNSVMLIEF